MTAGRVDEGWVLWVAAHATGRSPEELLAGADLGALAAVVADIDGARRADDLTAAATALASIARRRPLSVGNRAVSWMAAAILLADDRLASVDAPGAQSIVVDAERGAEPRAVAEALTRAIADATGPSRWARELTWACPACGRALHAYERQTARGMPLVGWSPFELTARCAYEHRAHDRRGRVVAQSDEHEAAEQWRPVVRDDRTGSLLVIGDDGAVLLVADGDGWFTAFALGEVSAGSLTGSWSALAGDGEPLGAVPPAEVALDEAGGMVEWRRLTVALDAGQAIAGGLAGLSAW